MNRRHIEIILYIEECRKYDRKCLLTDLIENFHVSERTIRYDLDEISRFFMQRKLPSLIIENDGNIRFQTNEISLREILKENVFYSLKLNKKERADMVVYLLLQADGAMTLQALADTLLVSRSTIIHDVENARKRVSPYGLKIIPLSRGLKVAGKESARRILLMNVMNQTHVLDYYYDEENSYFTNTDNEMLTQIIQQMEAEWSVSMTDGSFGDLLQYLKIMIQEQNKGRDIEIDYVLQHTSTTVMANYILTAIVQAFGFQSSVQERYLLSDILYNLKYIKRNDIDDNLMKIQIIAKEFIDKVSKKLNMNIQDDFRFYQNLVDHLQSTFKDIIMDIHMNSNLLADVVKDNPQIVEAIKTNIDPLEQVAGRNLSDDEVAYITIHVKAAIERNRERRKSLSVLLVSNTGKGELALLVSKLRKFFQFNVVDVIPYHTLSSYSVENIDLILSTVPIHEERCEYLLLTPDLKDEDCIILGNKIEQIYVEKREHKNNDDSFLNLQIEIANGLKEAPLDKDEIYKQIISILRKHFYPESTQDVIVTLQYLLKDHLALDVDAKDWRDAIVQSAKILKQEGYCNELYIDQMIQNVEKNGPYIVVAPGFAIPHESPFMGSYKLGMNLIRLKDPIDFGSLNDPVRYVCCLCTADKNSHLKPMFHLMTLIGKPDFVKIIDNAKTTDDLYSAICDYEAML